MLCVHLNVVLFLSTSLFVISVSLLIVLKLLICSLLLYAVGGGG